MKKGGNVSSHHPTKSNTFSGSIITLYGSFFEIKLQILMRLKTALHTTPIQWGDISWHMLLRSKPYSHWSKTTTGRQMKNMLFNQKRGEYEEKSCSDEKLTNITHLSRNLLIPVTTFIAIKYYFAISFYFNQLQVQNFWCWSLAGFLKGAKAPQTTTFYSDPCKQRPQPMYATIRWYCISHSNSSLNMFFPFFTIQ